VAALAFASPAHAVCPTTPVNWDAEGCDGRCTTTSTAFTCDVSGAGGSSMVVIVEDYATGAYEYEAWGNYNGNPFCCYSDADYEPTEIYIYGSAYSDTLEFTFPGTGSNLHAHTATPISAYIYGGTLDDIIRGSYDNTATYAEYLYGEGGDDIIIGNDGDDYCDGGGGNDDIDGNAGDDTIYGGAGNDSLKGGDGDDTIYGGDGIDNISGGAGDDFIDGGAGGDVICGDSETSGDTLDAGDLVDEAVPDKLWGANAADSDYCRTDGTYWDGFAADPTAVCAGNPTLAGKPGACP
jgi:hypothetical protein